MTAGPDKEEFVSFVYTPEEVAERWKCSPSFVRRMIADGKMPGAFRLGGKLLRIPIEAIEALERQSTISSGRSGLLASGISDSEAREPDLASVMRRRRLMAGVKNKD
ncbi:helix-turn-helix transcriptional regulator [Ancylobacter oerskovii]|uniref:Helix-turn-helix transcriptional regulator n=1 Tax=Ancylobacter oerskovii TaxID=459519 RepID=A0ABW4Z567_9HYPH|nr:helix-turn-helix domain-containing protein [Ancylobacter oerskovii]MBS7545736.1 helix-turn-helix domain-containing protein [Ancylobacter oerskovii]